MTIGRGIEQHRLGAGEMCLVQPIDEMTLVIGLADVQFKTKLRRLALEHGGDVVERIVAVDRRLPEPEQVEIGSIEDKDFVWHVAPQP